jgi:hypothetical protein
MLKYANRGSPEQKVLIEESYLFEESLANFNRSIFQGFQRTR